MRVLLAEVEAAEVTLEGPHAVWTLAGRLTKRAEGTRWAVRAAPQGIYLGERYVGPLVTFVPEAGAVRVGGRRYRGMLRVVWAEGRLLLINRLELEDYLKGVLPGEVPASFPFEALKAQAILARTYTLSRLGSSPYYDVCAWEACQVYKGLDAETPKHTRAVEATRGQILAYGGRPISAVYHADSGGQTASAYEVWGNAVPYLVVREDPYARAEPWRVRVEARGVQAVLEAFGLGVGPVVGLEVLGYSQSGRIKRLRVVGTAGERVLGIPEVTRVLRALGLPSTRARLEGTGPWVFAGRGKGHGVGMSQWGARGLAAAGWDYREILAYYYPGTVLTTYEVVAQREP